MAEDRQTDAAEQAEGDDDVSALNMILVSTTTAQESTGSRRAQLITAGLKPSTILIVKCLILGATQDTILVGLGWALAPSWPDQAGPARGFAAHTSQKRSPEYVRAPLRATGP
jgi:hypothetical protein